MNAEKIVYHGWQNCLLLSNSQVEVIVVPAVGRVMQFRFAGDESGPFWENSELPGRAANPRSAEWLNFGGDKTWPSPQGCWQKQTGQAWPPPAAFDSCPYEPIVHNQELLLRSEIDPHYGIRVVRHLRLAPQQPLLEITTEFHKIHGLPLHVGVWVITQLREPERIFALLPDKTRFADGYIQQMGPSPRELRRDGRFLSMRRDLTQSVKIGTEATALLWMDRHLALQISAQGGSSGEYPNGGSRTEIYTNPDALPYVELETEGPLETLKMGERMARTNTYRLFRRASPDCLSEARHIFGLD